MRHPSRCPPSARSGSESATGVGCWEIAKYIWRRHMMIFDRGPCMQSGMAVVGITTWVNIRSSREAPGRLRRSTAWSDPRFHRLAEHVPTWMPSRSTPFRRRTRSCAREANGAGWRGERGRDNPHTAVAAELWSRDARRAACSRGGVGGAHPDGWYGRRIGGSDLDGHGLSAMPPRSLDPGL